MGFRGPGLGKKQGEELRRQKPPSDHRLPLLFQLALTLPLHNLLQLPSKSQPGDCRPSLSPSLPKPLGFFTAPAGERAPGRRPRIQQACGVPGSGGQQIFGHRRGCARPVPRLAAQQSCSDRRALATLYNPPARGARGREKCGVGNSFAALPPTRSLFSTSEKCRALGSVFLFIPY